MAVKKDLILAKVVAKTEPINIPLSQLVVGMTVKLPLSWFNNPFFRNKVLISSQAEIELINSLGINYVTVIDGQHLFVEPVISQPVVAAEVAPAFDINAIIKKSVNTSRVRFSKACSNLRPAYSKVISDPPVSHREAVTVVELLLTHLHETKQPQIGLVNCADKEINMAQHGISVAVLSILMGHSLELAPAQMRDLALGCVFHDIGKLKIPDAIRRKRIDLTSHERNYIKTHPNIGYEMLDRSGLFPKAMLDIVLHHHEYIDGSGYPNKLTKNHIPLLTQIVILANDYTVLLESTGSAQLALGTLFKSRADKHDKALISILVKTLGVFPPGSIVKLSDGSIAKVMMTSTASKQPHVVSCSAHGTQASFRCLIDEGVTIVETVKLEDLSKKLANLLEVHAPVCFYVCHIND
ncbi:phosphohydrolase [Shewanella sp. 10N.286.52.B9]|nr:phosphohydrolase [Shewanella sp. 10N.286.52.B9]PMH84682.1 phosphohydrolase [Shewanella sp. 10N.286.48.B5]PMI02406.1 phosphohydrolase [Shewanella sp. 10N.286.48.A6]